jgi:hypothetical protein
VEKVVEANMKRKRITQDWHIWSIVSGRPVRSPAVSISALIKCLYGIPVLTRCMYCTKVLQSVGRELIL